MESIQRSARPQIDDMGLGPDSAFSLPEGREKISARIQSETKKKLAAIMEIWKVQTRVEVEAACKAQRFSEKETREKVEAAVEDVDLTYVVDKLLKVAADKELMQWKGFPDTPEKLSAVLKEVEKTARK